MADFGLTYRYVTNTLRAVDVDLNQIWTVTGAAQTPYSCANRTDGYFVVMNNIGGTYWLESRSTTNGNLIDSFNCSAEGLGKQNPFVIDHNNYVWSFAGAGTALYKWEQDFSSYTTYNLHGNCLASNVYNAAMTETGNIAITGPNVGRDYCTLLDGTNPAAVPIWNSPDMGANNAGTPCPGPGNVVFICGYGSGRRAYKLAAADGTKVWGANFIAGAGFWMSYVFETDRLFAGNYAINNDFRQYDPDTRAEIGDTADVGAQSYCFYTWDQDYGFGGASSVGAGSKITAFDLSEDWIAGEAIVDSRQDGANQWHAFSGDCTGYLHERLITLNASTGIYRGKLMLLNM